MTNPYVPPSLPSPPPPMEPAFSGPVPPPVPSFAPPAPTPSAAQPAPQPAAPGPVQPAVSAVSASKVKFPVSWKIGLSAVAVGTVVVSSMAGGVVGYAAGTLASPNKAAVVAATATPLVAPSDAPVVTNASGGVADIAAHVQPSVVQLDMADAQGSPIGTGSGFIISTDGYIVTNAHVAGAAEGEQITVNFANGDTAPGTVIGITTDYDLAVVKVDKTGLPALKWGDSEALRVGDPVVAVGSPLGLQGTVTSGIVSALDRPVITGESGTTSFMQAVQTDAAINPGNSGGPLINGREEVIGVNSAIASSDSGNTSGGQPGSIGLGFAIPANTAKRIADEIIAKGYANTPIIGVSVDETYEGPGAKVTDVTSGGPSDTAGMLAGDVIREVNGERVADGTALIVAIRSHSPGEALTLTVDRAGSTVKVSVVPSSAPRK